VCALSHAGVVDPLIFETDINALLAALVSVQLILPTMRIRPDKYGSHGLVLFLRGPSGFTHKDASNSSMIAI
jgi:hypothetical protein